MTGKGAALAILMLATTAVVSSCQGEQPSHGNAAPAPPTAPSPHTRAATDPILGVSGPAGGPPPECVESVVQRKQYVPTAEFNVKGQQGDTISYEVLKKDGSTTGASGDVLGPGQQGAYFATGVPNDEIQRITISAQGQVGVPGQCVITTIQ